MTYPTLKNLFHFDLDPDDDNTIVAYTKNGCIVNFKDCIPHDDVLQETYRLISDAFYQKALMHTMPVL